MRNRPRRTLPGALIEAHGAGKAGADLSVHEAPRMKKLDRTGPDRRPEDGVPIIALAHNEVNILGAFLDHYRAITRPAFLIVDDRSTDGTAEILADAPDVTVFTPHAGSNYRDDKAQWRSDLLDAYCDGRWCLAPDLDEHFVFPGMEARSLDAYCAALEAEGAEAVATLMIDMYADRPLAEHVFDPGDGRTLAETFPLFDGPAEVPAGYFMRPTSGRERKRWPTPPVAFSGGLRHRLFTDHMEGLPGWKAAAIERLNRLDRPINPGPAERARNLAARALTYRTVRANANQTKLGLIRWQAGMAFNGGAHKVDRALPVSESIAAFLHYKFTRGQAGLEYTAARGQHNKGARGIRKMLERGDVLARSPVWEGTRRYEGSRSLDGLIRDIPG